MARRILVALTALAALAGCGAPASAPTLAPVPGVEFNDTDVMYLQMSIAHHRQGIDLVRLAAGRPVRAQVGELARAIELTQAEEVESMTRWLTEWGKPADADPDPGAHEAHGGLPVTAPDTIENLRTTTDGEFERRFVTVLTGHQHGAVEMARAELAGGVSHSARALADRVVRSRKGQIEQLLTLTGQPG
ncbi:Uncharacterized conserved protein, DUF305 family [Actinokineospora alba]|uniref:Uncharacterized conserved protein, DUF305 family n=1 Tax=Actinokineospora alba TaxID=504798 RepID=A0A1H0W7M1_9PSEU|nr:DUF305 domain-containing protein [Actinokineospora alba]TDP69988.1 uncharacterized protein (DUF305 family) [Actinokineospora alba]SDJ50458.1 Uncharacterized conserved protein, DUF305 family [Actinokineospora alba]SDP86729.1 Uncharacterized conserved protein, DUF305 family [Actinokineospora alba]